MFEFVLTRLLNKWTPYSLHVQVKYKLNKKKSDFRLSCRLSWLSKKVILAKSSALICEFTKKHFVMKFMHLTMSLEIKINLLSLARMLEVMVLPGLCITRMTRQ